jgi:protein-tyrosine phosphatase
MQITAGSLLGSFGEESQQFCRWMLRNGLTHFVASDAHGIQRRRTRLSDAYQAVVELTDENTADDLLVNQPRAVALGQPVKPGRREVRRQSRWFGWLKAS